MTNRTNDTHKQGSGYHVPVLLRECIDGLAIKPDGVYVDCTFGGGGHSLAILERLSDQGRLIAFDQDKDAAANIPGGDERILFVPENFRHLQRFLRLHRVQSVDGILADLGVSSHQFDEAERGFSTRFDAALDMRMDQRQQLTAASIVRDYSEQQLHKIFEQYGEVTNAKTLARTLVSQRSITPIRTINDPINPMQPLVKKTAQKCSTKFFKASHM